MSRSAGARRAAIPTAGRPMTAAAAMPVPSFHRRDDRQRGSSRPPLDRPLTAHPDDVPLPTWAWLSRDGLVTSSTATNQRACVEVKRETKGQDDECPQSGDETRRRSRQRRTDESPSGKTRNPAGRSDSVFRPVDRVHHVGSPNRSVEQQHEDAREDGGDDHGDHDRPLSLQIAGEALALKRFIERHEESLQRARAKTALQHMRS